VFLLAVPVHIRPGCKENAVPPDPIPGDRKTNHTAPQALIRPCPAGPRRHVGSAKTDMICDKGFFRLAAAGTVASGAG
jgi:hypothetical protein